MYDCFRAVGWGGVIYSLVVFVIGVMIVMNLFLAILLSNFEGNEDMIKVDPTASTRNIPKIAPEEGAEEEGAEGVDESADFTALYVLRPGNGLRAKAVALSNHQTFEVRASHPKMRHDAARSPAPEGRERSEQEEVGAAAAAFLRRRRAESRAVGGRPPSPPLLPARSHVCSVADPNLTQPQPNPLRSCRTSSSSSSCSRRSRWASTTRW
jgi:hypothetical protein